MSDLAPEAEVLSYMKSLSNWGRWGEADERGTLNLITASKRVDAAGLVVDGEVISLGAVLDPQKSDPLERGSILQRYMMLYSGDESEGDIEDLGRIFGVREYVGIIPHGSSSHLDSLAHNGFEGRYYNGISVSETTANAGARHLDIQQAGGGVLSRGVLYDVPALSGREWLDPGEHITTEDLLAAEERQCVAAGEGDIFLLYTGTAKRIAAEGIHPKGDVPGLSASCLPFLHDRGVAMVGSDSLNDVSPSGYRDPDLLVPIHVIGLVAMGLWLADNLELHRLADECERRRRWEFMFSMSVWRLVGSTSSPVNPLAVF